jgi:hypothetical protein
LIVAFNPTHGVKWNFASLDKFSGTPATIEFVPDFEASRAAGNIHFVLTLAKWNVSQPSVTRDALAFAWDDGVRVEPYRGDFSHLSEISGKEREKFLDKEREDSEASLLAAKALVNVLGDNKWQADVAAISLPSPNPPVPRGLRIVVTFKPSPYFKDEWIKKQEKKRTRTADEHKKEVHPLPLPK